MSFPTTPSEDKKDGLASSSPEVHERQILGYVDEADSVDDATVAFANLVDEEKDHDIKLRTMGWKKAAILLFGEQVCLAIMAQSWSFSVLGWGPAMVTTILSGVFFWITSYTMWRFIMKHPHCRDICDIGYLLFGKSRIAYELSGLMLVCNNVLLIGFHVLTAAKIFNTLTDHSLCTVSFSVIGTVIGIVFSLPRTLNHVSMMSVVSAIAMAIAILLFLIFAGIESNPALGYGGEWPTLGPVKTYGLPKAGTTFVEIMVAVLNITFLWVPQLLFPSFIAEMKRPQDFPKALSALAIASFVLFIVPAAIGFALLGQYSTAPAFGSLQETYKKASFAFAIVPTIIIGVIYSNVTAKYIYRRIMGNSPHQHRNTVKGWAPWVLLDVAIWGISFIFASIIPSMGDFLGLIGALFDSFFGFIFWGVAYYHLHKGNYFNGPLRSANTVFHVLTIAVGLFLLGPGLYASVEAIKLDYSGATRPAFSCNNLAL